MLTRKRIGTVMTNLRPSLIHVQLLLQNSDPEKKMFVSNTALFVRRSQLRSENYAIVKIDRKKRAVLGAFKSAGEVMITMMMKNVRLCTHLCHSTDLAALMNYCSKISALLKEDELWISSAHRRIEWTMLAGRSPAHAYESAPKF